MSRSNGELPKYHKIIPPDEPEEYWGSSRTCNACNTHWPDANLFVHCPNGCNPTTVMNRCGETPDMKWQEALLIVKRLSFERFYEEWNEGLDDEAILGLWDGSEVDDKTVTEIVNEFIDDASKEHSNG